MGQQRRHDGGDENAAERQCQDAKRLQQEQQRVHLFRVRMLAGFRDDHLRSQVALLEETLRLIGNLLDMLDVQGLLGDDDAQFIQAAALAQRRQGIQRDIAVVHAILPARCLPSIVHQPADAQLARLSVGRPNHDPLAGRPVADRQPFYEDVTLCRRPGALLGVNVATRSALKSSTTYSRMGRQVSGLARRVR